MYKNFINGERGKTLSIHVPDSKFLELTIDTKTTFLTYNKACEFLHILSAGMQEMVKLEKELIVDEEIEEHA